MAGVSEEVCNAGGRSSLCRRSIAAEHSGPRPEECDSGNAPGTALHPDLETKSSGRLARRVLCISTGLRRAPAVAATPGPETSEASGVVDGV